MTHTNESPVIPGRFSCLSLDLEKNDRVWVSLLPHDYLQGYPAAASAITRLVCV